MSTPDISQDEIDAIYPKVAEIIADALGCDEDEVSPDSSLINDLDAESMLVSWVPGRGSPEPLYVGRGFVPTGEIHGGEVEARLMLR